MLFQTHEHRSQEDRALAWCEDVFRCKAHRYHDKTAPLDFWLERDGRVVAFGDVKSRTTAADQYPTLRMSTRKIDIMRLHAALHELPVLLVVPFGCGETRWLDVRDLDTPLDVTKWVRRAHRATNDTEPAFEIPLRQLRKAKSPPPPKR